ncbi:hypothetical protein [Devosia nitrariae]|nr:hypothetical protein [Devosia nitrariae]
MGDALRKTLDWSAVAEWQRLMAEWEAASADYDALRQASLAPELVGEKRMTLMARTAAARDRLIEIKASIDSLIKQQKSTRDVDSDEFIIARLETGAPGDETEPAQKTPSKR